MAKADDVVGRFFSYRAAALQSTVDATRDIIEHALTKGVEAESALAEMLASLLPGRFNARKGFLIDSDGSQSHELDLVIVDGQHIAQLFDFRSFMLVPVEAASAGIEVKTFLTKAELIDTFARFAEIQNFRFEKETATYLSGGVVVSGTTRPELTLFAYDASISREGIREVYEAFPDLNFVKICILQKGIIANIAESEAGALGLRWIEPQEPEPERFSGSVLSLFLYQLFLPALLEQRKGSDFYRHYLRGESVYRELK